MYPKATICTAKGDDLSIDDVREVIITVNGSTISLAELIHQHPEFLASTHIPQNGTIEDWQIRPQIKDALLEGKMTGRPHHPITTIGQLTKTSWEILHRIHGLGRARRLQMLMYLHRDGIPFPIGAPDIDEAFKCVSFGEMPELQRKLGYPFQDAVEKSSGIKFPRLNGLAHADWDDLDLDKENKDILKKLIISFKLPQPKNFPEA